MDINRREAIKAAIVVAMSAVLPVSLFGKQPNPHFLEVRYWCDLEVSRKLGRPVIMVRIEVAGDTSGRFRYEAVTNCDMGRDQKIYWRLHGRALQRIYGGAIK